MVKPVMSVYRAICLLLLMIASDMSIAQTLLKSPPASSMDSQSGEQANDSETNKDKNKDSPWLIAPILNSAPKYGTSLGAMAAYLHKHDEKSPISMYGIGGFYSNTDSYMYGAYAKTYFGEDKHRILAGVVVGKVNNEFTDFLGSGFEVKTTDDVHAIFLRYETRVTEDWFAGIQLISADYVISGSNLITDKLLTLIGLTGFQSNGIGLIAERDTRDNQNFPTSGSRFSIGNIAFRESFGGDYSFDTYTMKFSKYYAHGQGHVLAGRVNGNWTSDAPKGGYSTIRLRGYTPGQFLAPHSILFEVEERHHIKGRWGSTLFAGASCLYGDGKSCGDSENWYASAGAGITFMLKPKEKIAAKAEIAVGEGENHGFYLKFGQEF